MADTAVKPFTTSLSEWSKTYTNLVANDYEICGVEFDEYSKKCALEAITAIFNLVKTSPKVEMADLDSSNLRSIVEHCASLKLNANAYPRECYFQLRNTKVGVDEQGKDIWKQMVEMGIDGDGNDAILTNFGKDVEKVYPYWAVKEGDSYTPPKHKGIEITPPEWEEKGQSEKVVAVVYPVKLKDGTVVYLTANRDSVKVNLFAHIRNNLMNETFDIVKGTKKIGSKEVPRTRYDATEDEKKAIKDKKEEIYSALRECKTVEDMIACEQAKPYISAAWLDTTEAMILRKMRNNAIKKFPKNYNTMANKAYIEMDETYQSAQEDINENANKIEFDDVIDGEAQAVTE